MFKKILIANRGEIALRVVRACKDLGITACVAYSTADRNTAAVEEADERVCIGPAPSAQSYLDMARLVGAAVSRGCEAVHPGYGFLSENAEFARKCMECGLTFIGPDPDVIDRMGEKSNAKQTMKAAGVPTVPGSDGAVETVEEAAKFAEEVGYPVLIKASAGGGGKGMREVHDPADLEHEYNAARAEARVAFANDEVYLEKLITRPRHVEVQVMADNFGHAAAVCERDCSVQRRHQKLCEEAPSPALTPELRHQMCETAVKAVRATGYTNAGTIEFLLDEDGSFYFMEMNTRLQVEHPVTEFVSGVDLVKWQLRVAAGATLPFSQDDIAISGHAIECRINAETPEFLPSCGEVTMLHVPGGPQVRFDSALYVGAVVPPYYDSLLGKLIVCSSTRQESIRKMRSALGELVIEGVAENSELHLDILSNPEFVSGNYHTNLMEHLYE